jgi:hypothetical protein
MDKVFIEHPSFLPKIGFKGLKREKSEPISVYSCVTGEKGLFCGFKA